MRKVSYEVNKKPMGTAYDVAKAMAKKCGSPLKVILTNIEEPKAATAEQVAKVQAAIRKKAAERNKRLTFA